ncbi:hypothetical protein ACJX0J_042045, partial [Zea mays]
SRILIKKLCDGYLVCSIGTLWFYYMFDKIYLVHMHSRLRSLRQGQVHAPVMGEVVVEPRKLETASSIFFRRSATRSIFFFFLSTKLIGRRHLDQVESLSVRWLLFDHLFFSSAILGTAPNFAPFSHYIFLQKRNTEGGKQNASLKKAKRTSLPIEVEQSILKDLRNRAQLNNVALPSLQSIFDLLSLVISQKDKLVGATGKNVRTETSMVSVTLRVKPELTLPATYVCNLFLVIYGFLQECHFFTERPIEVEQLILEDLRNRAQLNNVALPSVSFYTFLNTHNGLNCSSISHDRSLVVGGFSDSSVKVWDMSKIGQPAKISSSQNENGCSHGEHISTLDEGKRTYTIFQGHSGPVYSAAFSPFGDFLLSSSLDLTIRLWSTKLNANLVCYKGHNYPVWDVQFSPVGHYFASASHDRTARIWSIDKIYDKTVRLWDVQTGECIRMFIGHRSMVLSLPMSPDGRYMASGDEDGTIMIWDLSTGRCVSPLLGHSSCVWTLAF